MGECTRLHGLLHSPPTSWLSISASTEASAASGGEINISGSQGRSAAEQEFVCAIQTNDLPGAPALVI